MWDECQRHPWSHRQANDQTVVETKDHKRRKLLYKKVRATQSTHTVIKEILERVASIDQSFFFNIRFKIWSYSRGSLTEYLTGLDSRELACSLRLPSMLVINDGKSDTGRSNALRFP